jgi:hypothetical protein
VRLFVLLSAVVAFVGCEAVSGVGDFRVAGTGGAAVGGASSTTGGAGGVGGTALEGYSRRRPIDVNAALLGAELSEFQLPVLIADDRELATLAASDGADLAFASADGTLLPFDVEQFDNATGRLTAWVRVATLDPAASPLRIYLYYGKDGATSVADTVTTWQGLAAVWHFADDLATGGGVLDSGPNAHTGPPPDSPNPRRSGVAGDGLGFEVNSLIAIDQQSDRSLDFGNASFTLTMWAQRVTGVQAFESLVWNGATDGFTPGYSLSVSGGWPWVFLFDDGAQNVTPSFGGLSELGGTWHHLAAVVDRDAEVVTLYRDGNEQNSDSIAGFGSIDNGDDLSFSQWNSRFIGAMDEVRLTPGALSPARIAADYITVTQHAQVVTLLPAEDVP